VVRVAEQSKIKFLFGFKIGEGFFRVRAHAQNRCVFQIESLLCVAKLGRFDRSTGRVGLGKEEQDNAFAAKIRQRYFFTLIGFQTEGRSLVTNFEHECTSAYQL